MSGFLMQTINIPFEDVITQFESVMASPLISGYIPWIIGTGLALWVLSLILKSFLAR